MADAKGILNLDALQRQKVAQALETQIGVVKRRMNAERSPEIKAILEKDVSYLVDLSRMFAL